MLRAPLNGGLLHAPGLDAAIGSPGDQARTAESPSKASQENQDRRMYEPFPGNYVWNLSVNICIGMGGAIGEIDTANERVRELAKQGEDAGTEAFFASW